jgi:hypothetical protein
MNKKMFTTILAGALTITAVLPLAVQAGRGNGGSTGGTTLQTQTRTQDRLRDGSCATSTNTQAGTVSKSGNTYGPGDGTGNAVRPQDGTGYGAPSRR